MFQIFKKKSVTTVIFYFVICVMLWQLYKYLYYPKIYVNSTQSNAHKIFGTSETSAIPNKIWSYWNGPMNSVVEKCIESWKHYNPNYEIVILNKDNIHQYCPVKMDTIKFAGESDARYSDYVRLNTLATHGGIWIDASCVCHQSFEWLHGIQNNTGCEMIGYYINNFTNYFHLNTSPIIESWFFACVPKSKFVTDWCNEFMRMNNFDSVDSYVKNVVMSGTDVQQIYDCNYLAIHVAAQHILQQFNWLYPTRYNLHVLTAENGPFLYLSQNKWNVSVSSESLKNPEKCQEYYKVPFIKLRGGDRRYLLENPYNINNIFSHIA